jgi:hypothetical protein
MDDILTNTKFKLIGLKHHHYIGKKYSGDNCDFESSEILLDRYIICMQDDHNQ